MTHPARDEHRSVASKKPLTLSEMQLLAQNQGGLCLSSAYFTINTPLTWQCRQGHQFSQTPAMVKYRNRWCQICRRQEKSTARLAQLRMVAEQNKGQCLAQVYLGVKHLMRWRCHMGHEWTMTATALLQKSWCPICKTMHQTLNRLKESQSIAERHHGRLLSEVYISPQAPLRWLCAQGHEFKLSAYRAHNNAWCLKCFEALPRLERVRIIAARHQGHCLSKNYGNEDTPLQFECVRHHQFERTAHEITKGRWCTLCAKTARNYKKEKKLFERQLIQ